MCKESELHEHISPDPFREQFEKIELAFAEVAGEPTGVPVSSAPTPTDGRHHSQETQRLGLLRRE